MLKRRGEYWRREELREFKGMSQLHRPNRIEGNMAYLFGEQRNRKTIEGIT